jgi:hypothetical protein
MGLLTRLLWENLNIGGRITLRFFLRRGWGGMDWINLALDWDRWQLM